MEKVCTGLIFLLPFNVREYSSFKEFCGKKTLYRKNIDFGVRNLRF
jgi:hypothetical protein